MVDDFDDRFFVCPVLASLLRVVGVDGFWVIIVNESRVSKLIGKRFRASNEIIEVLEFDADSFNAESNALFAFCLCLWRFDQWEDRIVLRDGVKYPWRWRRRVIVPVWVQVVIECEELLMRPVAHVFV